MLSGQSNLFVYSDKSDTGFKPFGIVKYKGCGRDFGSNLVICRECGSYSKCRKHFEYIKGHGYDNIQSGVVRREWGAKEKRAFRNIMFGLKKTRHMSGVECRFLTLTTSKEQFDIEGYDFSCLNDHFRVLKGRLLRLRPIVLVRAGYLSMSDAIFYYGHANLFKRFPFDYFKVITNEGYGVIHILYRGWFIPYNWLSDNWKDIHNSWNVNIQRIGSLKRDEKGVSRYLVAQYVSNQDASYLRFSQSMNWVYKGFVSDWRFYCRWLPRSSLFKVWSNHLKYVVDASLIQSRLDSIGLDFSLWST